ncbi:acyl-CoA-like ligand-binding transcription factor [Sphaerisporangium fuscum]|uniref:acyl-CoA-like ligand-binding transcription factor n=1 Tax=Sphaerisporangium fuscum TaxID=2835868 RepID=UPI001BDCE5C1|nr:TetR family transcriptional regulator [Sphaerisporangium fuscum]
MADDLRARPADEPLTEAIAGAMVTRFTPESVADDGHPRSRQWVDGIRLMLTEPEVQGEYLRANMLVQRELAKAIAGRTGTDVLDDMYPNLVAAATGAATTVAMEHWLRADPTVAIGPLLREVLDQLWAGLPTPPKR